MCEHPIKLRFLRQWPINFDKLDEWEQKEYRRGYFWRPSIHTYEQQVPCGWCLECKLAKAKDWAARCVAEAKSSTASCFVTLTYNDHHLPLNDEGHRTLVTRDMQLFFKKLLKKYPKKGIRRFYCGEYGDKKGRPHYHAIIFNYCPSDLVFYKKGKNGDPVYKSAELQRIWGKGFVTVGFVTAASAGYVARYTLKKAGIKPSKRNRRPNPAFNPFYDRLSKENRGINKYLYDKPTKQPEFTNSSRRPGIGAAYWESHKQEIIANSGIYIKTPNKGVQVLPIPKYFKKQWIKEDYESYYRWSYKQQLKFEKDKQEELAKHPGWTYDDLRRYQIESLHKRCAVLKRNEEFAFPENTEYIT